MRNRYKTIGILGGMGPASTMKFYEKLIKRYIEIKKDYHFPEIVIVSLSFGKIRKLQAEENKRPYIDELVRGIRLLKTAGAHFAVIASNTPHMYYNEIQSSVDFPVLSIVKSVVSEAQKHGLKRLLLLGTMLTMKGSFYKNELKKRGILTIVPGKEDSCFIDRIIYEELIQNVIKETTRKRLVAIVNRLIKEKGIDGVILGCTELPLILTQDMVEVSVLDTLDIHVNAALDFSF